MSPLSTLWTGVDCRKGAIQLRSEVVLNVPAPSAANLFHSGKCGLKTSEVSHSGAGRDFRDRDALLLTGRFVLNQAVFGYHQGQGSRLPPKAVHQCTFIC